MNDYSTYYKINNEFIVEVAIDECPLNPREGVDNDWLEGWHLVCAEHLRYNLPCEKHPHMSYKDMRESDEYQTVPLSFLDHSGTCLMIGSVNDWDTCECGYAWRKKFDDNERGDSLGLKWLRGVLDEYNNWANGNVFGCTMMDFEGNVTDSLWGLIEDCAEDALKRYLEEYAGIIPDEATIEEVKPKYKVCF